MEFNRGGHGLGLSICHKIVKAMGGSLTVESKNGVGTVFTVALLAEFDEAKSEKIRVKKSLGLIFCRLINLKSFWWSAVKISI